MSRMYKLFAHRLESPEPGAGGGGGGGGGGAPGEMPPAWAEQIQELVGKMINGAISARDKQSDKKREQDKSDFKKMLEESLQGIKPAPGNGGGDDDPDKGKGKGKDDIRLTTLQQQMNELKQRSESWEKKANEERAARRQVGLVQTVTQALSGIGITGDRADAARDALLFRNRVGFVDDESDEIVFRGDDGLSTELALGLRQWAKTPAAQIYLPPSGTAGSGSRPGGRNPNGGGGSLTQDQRLAILQDQFDRNMP